MDQPVVNVGAESNEYPIKEKTEDGNATHKEALPIEESEPHVDPNCDMMKDQSEEPLVTLVGDYKTDDDKVEVSNDGRDKVGKEEISEPSSEKDLISDVEAYENEPSPIPCDDNDISLESSKNDNSNGESNLQPMEMLDSLCSEDHQEVHLKVETEKFTSMEITEDSELHLVQENDEIIEVDETSIIYQNIGSPDKKRKALNSLAEDEIKTEIFIFKEDEDSRSESIGSIKRHCNGLNHTHFDHNYHIKNKYFYDDISLIALAERPFSTGENFLKGCKWAPDGTCLLTSSQDSYLRVFDLPQDVAQRMVWKRDDDQLPDISPSLKVFEGGLICDFTWYPKMISEDPITCCFLSTSAGSPIHLWDATTSQLKATYLAYDYADEVTSALSISFDTKGDKIFSGYKNHVRIFDVAVPGRSCTTINLKALSKQKGLVSCIQENPGLRSVFAVGTYRKTIGLYTLDGCNLCILKGQKGGVTQIMFSKDGSKIYSGARKDNEILCWDLRNPGQILYTMQREVTTNQRIYFDLTHQETHILSGGTDGVVRIWKLPSEKESSGGEQVLEEYHQFKAHKDCVNGISLNPVHPILATSSGQRIVAELASDEEEIEFSLKTPLMKKEFSLKLWWLGPRVSARKLDVQSCDAFCEEQNHQHESIPLEFGEKRYGDLC